MLNWDSALRLQQYHHQFSQSDHALAVTFGYNPAGQVTSRDYSNPDYLYSAGQQLATHYQVNALNQYDCIGSEHSNCAGGDIPTYDGNGNLKAFEGDEFTYDAENRLTSLKRNNVTTSYTYDPMGRLVKAGNIEFLYDGDALIAQYQGNTLTHRFVHGIGMDTPLAGYTGSGVSTSNLYYLHADHQGSIVAHSNSTGTRTKHNNFDEYGIPGQTNSGLFAYTGQIVLPGSDTTAAQTLYHYKARVYHPRLGRFLQTDPIGYEDQMNLYAYVGNDPVNIMDPSGEFGTKALEWSGRAGWAVGGLINTAVKHVTGVTLSYMIADAVYNVAHNNSADESIGDRTADDPLPRDPKTGEPIPESEHPHTQLGTKTGRRGRYRQGREFGQDGDHIKDIDFTDHGRSDHPNPHEHPMEENATGGTKKRGDDQPLQTLELMCVSGIAC